MNRLLRIGLMAAISALACGCPAPGTHDPGYVAKEWSMTIREFGIVPVFPPREDVQVGDIYISPTTPDPSAEKKIISRHDEFLPIPVLVGSVDLRGPLNNYYRNRLSLPATPGTPSTQPAAILQPHGSGSIFLTGDNSRPRLAGFPEFFSAQISRGGLDGLVPTEAVDVAFGAFASSNKTINVSVPMVESYGLPFSVIGAAVTISPDGRALQYHETAAATRPVPTTQPGDSQEPLTTLSADEIAKLFEGNKVASTEPGVIGYLRLITEVYATRAIDVSVQATEGFSGGVNADLTTKALQNIPSLSAATRPSTTQQTQITATTEPASFDQPTPQQVAASLTDQLNQSLQAALPGVSVKFLSVSAYGVSMRRTYERPVVIGYRAVLIKLAHRDGPQSPVVFSLAGVSSSTIPVSKSATAEEKALMKQLSDQFTEKAKALDSTINRVDVTFIAPTEDNPHIRVKYGITGGISSKAAEVSAALDHAAANAISDHSDVLKGAVVENKSIPH